MFKCNWKFFQDIVWSSTKNLKVNQVCRIIPIKISIAYIEHYLLPLRVSYAQYIVGNVNSMSRAFLGKFYISLASVFSKIPSYRFERQVLLRQKVEVTHRLARWQRRERQGRDGRALCAAMRKRGAEGIVRRRWQPGSVPFIYLTPSSSARTSVSGALTHSMPETIALVRSFTRSGSSIIDPVVIARRCFIVRFQRANFRSRWHVAALHLEIYHRCRRVVFAFSGRAYRFAWWHSSIVSRLTLLRADRR